MSTKKLQRGEHADRRGYLHVYVPFSGFYESLHSAWLETAIEGISDPDDNAITCDHCQVDCNASENNYASEYADQLASLLGINIEFDAVYRPKEYNFTTDSIGGWIKIKTAKTLLERCDKDALRAKLKDRFTSCDGFSSWYRNDLNDWGPINEWDCIQLETLLIVLLEEIDPEYEFNLAMDIVANEMVEYTSTAA